MSETPDTNRRANNTALFGKNRGFMASNTDSRRALHDPDMSNTSDGRQGLRFKDIWKVVADGIYKRRRVLLSIVLVGVFIKMAIAVLVAGEYSWQTTGFEWIGDQFHGTDKANMKWMLDPTRAASSEPFPGGRADISGLYVFQEAVLDCRFLACLSSFANTRAGGEDLFHCIRKVNDELYAVKFRGMEKEILIKPLSEREVIVQGHVRKERLGKNIAYWVPLLEKAYGKYRHEHQDVESTVVHYLRHALFEGRSTSTPLLDSFGATYGARDDQAIELLTGIKPRSLSTVVWEIGENGLGKDYVSVRQIRSWFNRAGVEAEFHDEQATALNEVFTKGGIAIATTEISPAASAVGLWSNHAYSVIGFDNTTQLITIRDPMGKVEPRDNKDQALDGVIDGVFKVTLPEFNRYFSHLSVASM